MARENSAPNSGNFLRGLAKSLTGQDYRRGDFFAATYPQRLPKRSRATSPDLSSR